MTVGDYSSDDGTKELAEEFGFKVITVPKTRGIAFYESKIENAIIFNMRENFLVDLNIHYKYPKRLDKFCKNWLKKNIKHIKTKILILRGKYGNRIKNGLWLVYKPYWLEVRGFDERITYPYVGIYGTEILLRFWNLKYEECYIGMIHKEHIRIRTRWRKTVIKTPKENKTLSYALVNDLIKNKDVSKVKNSYW
ncbi:MAG: hypothetical protein ACTSQY_00215 [Candidatus Odinarchaeia archaeon]|nr:MAG: hypothetical protein [Lokiarchaeota virus Fenrir Meg22_1012]URC17222.1 MAG: hypothetical protein [Lokiarchaeota virus Fenrir Meg22_1214]